MEAPRLGPVFDAFDPGEESRAVLAQTFAFLDAHLRPLPPAPADGEERAAARRALGQLFAGEFESAHEYYNEVAAGAGNLDSEVWENLAWARRGLGSVPGEVAALLQGMELAPEDVGLRRRYARINAMRAHWKEVESALAPVATSPELDAIDLGLLGLGRLLLDRPADAIAPLELAVALGGEPNNGYNLACAYARVGRVDDAFAALEQALALGLDGSKLRVEDPDLAMLRADPRFADLLARVTPPAPSTPPTP
jgi:tetratricopeptide (TPR) repeat protein